MTEILIVDDDLSMVRLLSQILASEGRIRFATNGQDALRLARETPPDLVMLDGEMPGMSGLEVCAALKADAALFDTPVVFISAHRDQAFEVAGFAAGASDFLLKPVSPPIVMARARAQLRFKHMADELRRTATVDSLTGIANRRRFDDSLQREWLRARRDRDALSLILIDVDHFKLFNDRYGHPAGDTCLISIAGALSAACMRPGDLVARYGGEEFALLLPGTPAVGAQQVAERIQKEVRSLAIEHLASPTSKCVTLSAGIASFGENSGTWRTFGSAQLTAAVAASEEALRHLLEAADTALYAAKHSGRDRYLQVDVDDSGEMIGDPSVP